MNKKIHPEKLKNNTATIGITIDLIMIILVIINLSLITFDWAFSSAFFQEVLSLVSVNFVTFYKNKIHADFIFYDMIFISVYLMEFSIRWLVALRKQTYHKWFFYPFIHWYDLIGCIPVGGFRWLRILRIISILVRLQKLGVIELQETVFGSFIIKYYRVIIEEISDRVVLNVLEDIQQETIKGSPLIERIETEVLLPRKAELIHLLVERIQLSSKATWSDSRSNLHKYFQTLSENVIQNSKAGHTIASVPIIGNRLLEKLDEQLSDMLLEIIDQVIKDVSNIESQAALEKTFNKLISNVSNDDTRTREIIHHIVIDTLESVKTQVRIQHWKEE
jgi:hypothetical protein